MQILYKKWDLVRRDKVGYLGKWDAQNKITAYINKMEKIKQAIRKNFSDMDLENNNRREEIEEIVETLESDCATAVEELKRITFE